MVELKNVSVRYGSEATDTVSENSLSDVNFTVRSGEFVLLTGPSGCGKTTILRLINGLIPHFYPGEVKGEVLIDGENITRQELYDTALRVGTVFQNPRTQFYNVDTTGELAFACENRGMPETEICRRIDETVGRFHMESLMDRNIFHLSGGEKQKIACAAADVAGPELLLLDEPSANLDYESMMGLREMLRVWQRQGKTVIVAEHRIAYLWDLADRAVIMQHGEIVRELCGTEKEALTVAELTEMGLRSTLCERPDQVPLQPSEREDKRKSVILRDFHFSYAGQPQPVLNISELSLAEGEITAITGGNGHGKTTFLNCLCGLEKRCGGALEYHGKTYNRTARQQLCFMVMQDTGNQLFTESVLDEVIISLPKGTGNEREQAEAVLKKLDLGDLLDRHPQSLSGGQKQRLAIACAVASGRKLLLLDEPTSGLDHAHMLETAMLLRQLKAEGTTILVVTHDSELIRACCTRRVVFPETSSDIQR